MLYNNTKINYRVVGLILFIASKLLRTVPYTLL